MSWPRFILGLNGLQLNQRKMPMIRHLIFCWLVLFPCGGYAGDFFIASYEFNDRHTATIASKYDFVITAYTKASAVSKMKTARPDMKAVYYRNALTLGDKYYVLDVKTGKRIVHNDWGWYLHDISNSNYCNGLAHAVLSRLNTYPQFDGVLLDDVKSQLDPSEYHQEGTSKPPTFPPELVKNWQAYMIQLLQAVRAAIGPKMIILNCGWYATNYLAHADGQVDENFSHANWEDPKTYLGTQSWLNHLNAMKNAVATSKYYLAQSGVKDGATQVQIAKLVRYCFCSFLMGVESNKSFAKHYFCPSIYYKNYYWYSDWEMKLGDPTGGHFQIPGTSLFRRNFQKGIVLVNPGANTGKFTLEKTYCNLEGQSISEVMFSDHEGIILLHCDKERTPMPAK